VQRSIKKNFLIQVLFAPKAIKKDYRAVKKCLKNVKLAISAFLLLFIDVGQPHN
jgi:hypothetical protein